jgi:ribosomal protein S6--L-glutamate ligase
MKIVILSRRPRSYSTTRLKQAGKDRGHKVRVLDTAHFTISLEKQFPDLFYRGRAVSTPDAVIPRIGPSLTYFGTAVVRQFEQMGVFCANSALGITRARDKLRCLQILSNHDVGIPHTAFARDKKDVLPAIERLGGAPIIIKLLEGTQGIGVILAESIRVAEAIIQTLQSARQNVLIQKFVAESKGTDIRAFVVGNQVAAAMRRVAQGQEFRSNIHRGGRPEPVQLEPAYERAAVRATQLIGLRFAGVDILEGQDGPQILEVNSAPGLQGIEETTGVDVAGAIIDYVEDQVTFPDMDLRQRLTISQGYGVGDVPVPRRSELAGKAVADARVLGGHMFVLTLTRGDTVIPQPEGELVLQVGDRLLCFGRLAALRKLIPPRVRRRVRKLPRTDGGSMPPGCP